MQGNWSTAGCLSLSLLWRGVSACRALISVHLWHLEVQIEPASPARHCAQGVHTLCWPFCRICAFILVRGIPEQTSNQGLESKPLASLGGLSAVSSCRAVSLATAQVSCLLAQAMEANLAFPCNPEHTGGSCAHCGTCTAWIQQVLGDGQEARQKQRRFLRCSCPDAERWMFVIHSCHRGREQA